MKYKLECRYDSHVSFYGKAVVEEYIDTFNESNGKVKRLISYSTHVATIKNGVAHVKGTYSQTTLRHIKEFLKQNGFVADTAKQIMKDYGDES